MQSTSTTFGIRAAKKTSYPYSGGRNKSCTSEKHLGMPTDGNLEISVDAHMPAPFLNVVKSTQAAVPVAMSKTETTVAHDPLTPPLLQF